MFTRAQRCFRESKGSVLLTGVKSEGLPEERYAYDPAGNMIEKAIGGDKTAMTYDLANRLLAATGKQEARYAYDPAGRIKEEILGGKATQYEYGLLGKVSRVKEGDARRVDYQYWPDGQTAWKGSSASMPDSHTHKPHNTATSYLWDGLALLARGDENFTVEPHVSGGVPVMASGKEGQTVVISDFLGTTLGVVKGEEFIPTPLTAFGEVPNREPGTVNGEPGFEGFFTGKPYDPDLKAYTFLFRNYRPELGRWTAKDPAGFPDGVNNSLYVLNRTSNRVDPYGLVDCSVSYSDGLNFGQIDTFINMMRSATLTASSHIDPSGKTCWTASVVLPFAFSLESQIILPQVGQVLGGGVFDQTFHDTTTTHENWHHTYKARLAGLTLGALESWSASYTSNHCTSQNAALSLGAQDMANARSTAQNLFNAYVNNDREYESDPAREILWGYWRSINPNWGQAAVDSLSAIDIAFTKGAGNCNCAE